ncbi:hypothetical protein ABW21_db0200843 [Orbilia brochopaga]|nr:hypothetical protein ABW21_db0200843 [Drechslerella brochopaga]
MHSRIVPLVPLASLLIRSASALRVGAVLLDEQTRQPLGLDPWIVCRPPDNHPEWGIEIIDPLVTLCAAAGPEGMMNGGQGLMEDWKLRASERAPPDADYTYVYLVGTVSPIPMTNNPEKPRTSWFGYGVNSFPDYEASVFEVTRAGIDGRRVPQKITPTNPLQVDDYLEWAGPNGVNLQGDYQLRMGSNSEVGGIQRIARSDRPYRNYPPIRLTVLELDETDLLDDPSTLDKLPGLNIITDYVPVSQKPQVNQNMMMPPVIDLAQSINNYQQPRGQGINQPMLDQSIKYAPPMGQSFFEKNQPSARQGPSLLNKASGLVSSGFGLGKSMFGKLASIGKSKNNQQVAPVEEESKSMDNPVLRGAAREEPRQPVIPQQFGVYTNPFAQQQEEEEVVVNRYPQLDPIPQDASVNPGFLDRSVGVVRGFLDRINRVNNQPVEEELLDENDLDVNNFQFNYQPESQIREEDPGTL